MFDTSIFSSRSGKEELLKSIINKLSISNSEKEMYILSLGILNDTDFLIFFGNITAQINNIDTIKYSTIEPFSTTFI